MKTVIRGGTVVTASDTYLADILIDGDTIAAVGRDLGPADREIDASDQYIFPGGIDEHTHFGLPVSNTVSAPWETESVAAAMGGTTTVIDFAMQSRGGSLLDGIREWKEERAEGHSAVDYGFHITLVDLTPEVLREIPALVEAGVPTIKCLMAYKGTVMVDDATLFRALRASRESGALILVHCENGDIVYALQQELIAAGKTEPRYHAASRPPECEGEATHRAIVLAEMAGAPLFVVHVTAAQAVQEIQAARARGLPVYAETCPQYLTLTVDELDRPNFEGAKYVCSPALRTRCHQDVLWDALRDGALQAVGSDHCAFNFRGQKEMGRERFTLIPNGLPTVEERLPILYSRGVIPGHLSLNRFVEVISTAPAKLMGLYPRKGTIAVGSDADLVLFDPDRKWTMGVDTQHSAVDYSAFEGLPMQGAVQTVFLRGEVIVQHGTYTGTLGQGRFIPRKPFVG